MKYELLPRETHPETGELLCRIRALRDIPKINVKTGDVGGFVSSDQNLSQDGNCWIFDDASVTGDAEVTEQATIHHHARVINFAKVTGDVRVMDHASVTGYSNISGHATVMNCATVAGYAFVTGNSTLKGHCWVRDDARIRQNATICEHCSISDSAIVQGYVTVAGHAIVRHEASLSDYCDIRGYAVIRGRSKISGAARIYGNPVLHDCSVSGPTTISGAIKILTAADIQSDNDVFSVSHIGSRGDTTTFYKGETEIRVTTGCFSGSIDEFKDQVLEVHENSPCAKAYLMCIELAKFRLGEEYTPFR